MKNDNINALINSYNERMVLIEKKLKECNGTLNNGKWTFETITNSSTLLKQINTSHVEWLWCTKIIDDLKILKNGAI